MKIKSNDRSVIAPSPKIYSLLGKLFKFNKGYSITQSFDKIGLEASL